VAANEGEGERRDIGLGRYLNETPTGSVLVNGYKKKTRRPGNGEGTSKDGGREQRGAMETFWEGQCREVP